MRRAAAVAPVQAGAVLLRAMRAPSSAAEAEAQAAAADDPRARAAPLPPWPVLAVAAVVSLLHALPFLRTRLGAPAPGMTWEGVPFIEKDWLAYLALVRQRPRAGELLLANPFTTEPQGGRFVLLFHQALNAVHRVTGLDPGWILEIARTALILALAVVLWRFLADAVRSERTRAWAVGLALAAGGVAFLALWAAEGVPSQLAASVRQELWPMYGWTTYEALHNPLWVAGLVLLLLALRPLLRPGGPRSGGEIAGTAAALVALWFTHPYSAIAAAAIVVAAVLGEWLLTGTLDRRRVVRAAAGALPALGVAGLATGWQLGDPAYRQAASGVLGPQSGQVFWYPVAFGLLGAFALVGLSEWIRERNPWRFALGGWLAGIALLHSSPILNGYHFIPFAHLPVAVLAAGPVERVFAGIRARGGRAWAWAIAVAALLLANTGWNAVANARDVEVFQMPAENDAVLAALARLPAGNVLCDPALGNVVPAYSDHRVWVGHWFMTPDFQTRASRAKSAIASGDVPALREIVAEGRIDYVVLPARSAAAVAEGMPELAPRVDPVGAFAIVRLERPVAP